MSTPNNNIRFIIKQQKEAMKKQNEAQRDLLYVRKSTTPIY